MINRVRKQYDRRSGDWLLKLSENEMKEGIHPDYREVLVHALSCDFKFVTRSTVQPRDNMKFEGKDYPLLKIEFSS